MAKQTSLFGKISGKIGSVVFSTSGGETISREYNPHVANPSTMAQVNQRARLKLMSQLSASLAPVIAIPKQGLVSSRNAFTKLNFDASMAENGVAQISYENVQLTNGNLALPTLEATRAQGSGITINLSEDASTAVSRVVYILYRKTSEQKLQLVSSLIVEAPGANGTFPATLPYTEGDVIIYAYGMRDTSESASAKYGNMQVANAIDIARLTAYRNISTEDFQFTQTRGATMFADQSELTPVPEGSARVFVTALGNGSVSGSGIYELGQTATVVATASPGYVFVGWQNNGSVEIISTDASYSFAVSGTTDLVAVFMQREAGQTYRIQLRPSGNEWSQNTKVRINNGEWRDEVDVQVDAGDEITIEASANSQTGIVFSAFRLYQVGTYLSNSNPYTFVPNGDMNIVAGWSDDPI